MKMMIWKELRENIRWAILAMIGLGMAEFYGLFYRGANEDYSSSGLPLMKATFLMATTFGCALVGLLLGFLQILPEQRRDQWAALVHRPVSRSVIFRGKVAAGLVLYLLATIVPFSVCVWFAATPGHFNAPFVPTFILPGLSDIFLGAVYYFAALLVTLQRGSWFGARTLALFAAVHLSFYASGASYFRDTIEAATLMGLAIFIAAWGAILSNGSWSVRPWPTRLALLAIVFFGLCGVGDIATMLARTAATPSDNRGSQYQFTREGQPIIISTNPDLTTTVKDLDGNVITDERYKGRSSYDNLAQLGSVTNYVGDAHGLDVFLRYRNYRNGYTYATSIRVYSPFGLPVQWYYLRDRGYFIGISNLTKRPVGMADRKGFHPWDTTPEPFDAKFKLPSTGTPTLATDGSTLYVYDFMHEKEFQLTSPDSGEIYGASDSYFRTDKPGTQDYRLVMALAHELAVFDNKGAPVTTLPYHQDVDQNGSIGLGIGEPPDHYFILYGVSYWIDWAKRSLMPIYYDIVDGQGNVTKSYDLPTLPYPYAAQTWFEYFSESVQSPAFWYGTIAWQKAEGDLGIKHYEDRSYNPNYPSRSHPAWVGKRIVLVSLLFAAVGLFLARRNRFSWRASWAWALLVFLFNLGGLLAFRLVADWPVNIKCPQCGSKRPVAETTCPHCQAIWPLHKPDGIEIFEKKNPVAELVS